MIRLRWTSVPDTGRAAVHFRTESALVSRIVAEAPLDRRAARTRLALSEALIELLGERGWDDIAVQDVCERADVARSTFYLHYDGKEALLQGGFDGLRAALKANALGSAAAAKGWSGFTFVAGLAEHVQQNRRIFRSVVGRRSGHAVHQRFREMIVRLIDDELPPGDGVLPRDARARCLGALLTELLGWWVDQGAKDAGALAARFNRAAAALLAAR
jgi:AcrR family transcriptional regulator